MPKLNYLTPQDFIWINHRVTQKVNTFDYRQLEDGVYQQYGYRDEVDVLRQAARLLTALGNSLAFSSGNRATAFVGFVAFLETNGMCFSIGDPEAAAWIKDVLISPETAESAVRSSVGENQGHDHAEALADVIFNAIARYPKTLESLRTAPKPTLSVTV